jgi:DNA-directed RNA polymerase specialized sigma subunit
MGIEKSAFYRRTEKLLQEYRAIAARIKILEAEQKAMLNTDITESTDEAIAGMYFARTISDMPHGTDVADKTERIALQWRDRYQKEFHHVWRQFVLDKQNMVNELTSLRLIIQKIDMATESLLPKEKEVITLFYIQGLKWENIGQRLQYSKHWCKQIRERAIWYMSKSMFGGKWKEY